MNPYCLYSRENRRELVGDTKSATIFGSGDFSSLASIVTAYGTLLIREQAMAEAIDAEPSIRRRTRLLVKYDGVVDALDDHLQALADAGVAITSRRIRDGFDDVLEAEENRAIRVPDVSSQSLLL